MKKSSFFNTWYVVLFFLLTGLAACEPTADVFENDVAIPKHAWSPAFKPQVSFTISDTTALYNIYVVLRHTDAYRYKNIWLNITLQSPGDTSIKKHRFELTLGSDEKGWLGSGMDDVYEHRVLLFRNPVPLARAGTYTFILENIMRDEPLEHVLNVGIRVEKVN